MLSLEQLRSSPEWFPDAIYADRGLLDCYRVDRHLLAEAPFLDQRMTSRAGGKIQIVFSFDELAGLAAGARMADIGFVLHTSFCRSTLMAQALHVDGVSFSLKEPSILLSLAESHRYTQTLRDPTKLRTALPAMLRLATGLVDASEKVIVKPTNFANNLLPYVADSGAKILLMYSDLQSYLVSILKYGERGRAFARQLFTRLLADYAPFREMEPRHALLHTDLQIAALVWKQQMNQFKQILSSTPAQQVRTLASDDFGAHREAALAETFKFFSVPLDAGQFAGVLSSAVFQQHSKSGRSVDNQEIQQQNQAVADRHRDEIQATLQWAASTPLCGTIEVPLPNALLVPALAES